MIFSAEFARTLDALIHPDVETQLIELLEELERQELVKLANPDAKFEDLKLLQGRIIVLKELKQYKQRILDAITNGT